MSGQSPYPLQVDVAELRRILDIREIRMPPFWFDPVLVGTVMVAQSFAPEVHTFIPDWRGNIATNGPITTPGAANTVLAATPQFAHGAQWDLGILITTRAVFAGGGNIVLQRRNASDTANVYEFVVMPIPNANDIPGHTYIHLSLGSADGERFRIVALESYTGICSGTLFWRRRSPIVAPRDRPEGN